MNQVVADRATPSAAPSVLRNARAIFAVMGRRRRLQLYVTLGLMLLGAVAELMTIGAVLPLLALAADPAYGSDLPIVQAVLKALGVRPGTNLIVPAAILLIAAALSSATIRLTLTWVSQKLIYGIQHDIVTTIFGRLLRQPYDYYVRQNSSVALSALEKTHLVIVGVVSPAIAGVTSGGIALFIIVFLFAIDPVTAGIAAASVGILYLLITLASKRAFALASKKLAAIRTTRVKTMQESLGGIRDIMLDQSQALFERRLAAQERELQRLLVIANFSLLSPRLVVEAAGIILIAVIAVYYSWQPGGVLAVLPLLGALAVGAQRLLPLIQTAYLGWAGYAVHAHVLDDILALMNAPVSTAEARAKAEAIVPFGTRIAVENVSFAYAPGEFALKDINLVIRKGERVGFIGKTGSGKSTLVDVLMGLLRPTEGHIALSGEVIDDSNLANWQAQIAHVPQDIFLTDDTIAANIAFGYGDEERDMDRVREAAEKADVLDFIERLPEGFATKVGERGIRLSAGQKQRIGIARALYKQATVLILDEATSALDDQTEAAVMESVASLDRELTVIMIAHRLSTVAVCDTVYRLDGGRIRQSGSYQEVVRGRPEAKTLPS